MKKFTLSALIISSMFCYVASASASIMVEENFNHTNAITAYNYKTTVAAKKKIVLLNTVSHDNMAPVGANAGDIEAIKVSAYNGQSYCFYFKNNPSTKPWGVKQPSCGSIYTLSLQYSKNLTLLQTAVGQNSIQLVSSSNDCPAPDAQGNVALNAESPIFVSPSLSF